jgi:hypothetical protein
LRKLKQLAEEPDFDKLIGHKKRPMHANDHNEADELAR